jgi:nitroimidazol reductase NimA-like FMN-containing flavoprotein (pyridoxamine 5'-phosphate oxidase superfamily)
VLVVEGLELLDEAECLGLMASVRLGRIAVTMGALPAVFPVNFEMRGGDIYFRTGAGTKMRTAVERAIVAFEVDQFDETAQTGWSVLVVGQSEVVSPQDAEFSEVAAHPLAGGDRHNLVRIRPELVSGRRLIPPSG